MVVCVFVCMIVYLLFIVKKYFKEFIFICDFSLFWWIGISEVFVVDFIYVIMMIRIRVIVVMF